MTDDIYETPSSTPNFQTELAQQLAALVPEAVADGKIDVLKLQELLAQDAAETSERFGLSWPGKQRALRIAQMPTSATLTPQPEKSKCWDTTKNVFIEGDNLEALKILQKHYHGKIKLIYIDPPYNTGKDFVYPDNYKEGLESYLEWTRQVNEEGKQVSTNSETEGRYHSNWLNMMYPRLKLARNLLAKDGLIMISIGDSEVQNLKQMMLEIFGEQNYEGHIHWRRRHNQPNDANKLIGLVAEHILVFARNSRDLKEAGVGKLELSGKFTNPDNDPRGPWNSKPWKVGSNQSGSRYLIQTPSGQILDEEWMGDKGTFDTLLADGRIYFPKGGDGVPRKKIYQSERLAEGQSATNWFSHEAFGSNQEGTAELEKLFSGRKAMFDNPKPTKLVKNLLRLANIGDNDVVLDFFAGSSTTAHAVLLANEEDGGSRRFIEVQLPEPTPSDSEARKAGYLTISDLSVARIKLSAEAIEREQEGKLEGAEISPDRGFRAYKLSETNFSKWQVTGSVGRGELEGLMLDFKESASDEATSEDILTEILLKQGYSLSEQIEKVEIGGLQVHSIGQGLALAYLNEHSKPTLDQLRLIIDEMPARLVVLEDVFAGDDQLKTNLAQLCRSKNIELWTA
jgi:adenine-specific DNA-methyltransferase